MSTKGVRSVFFYVGLQHHKGSQHARFRHRSSTSTRATRSRESLKRVFSKSARTDLEETWNVNILDFSIKTYGFAIKGTGTVEAENVQFKGELPFAAVAFRGKIEQSIREELSKELA